MKPRLTSLHVRPPILCYRLVQIVQNQVISKRYAEWPSVRHKNSYVFIYDPVNPGHMHHVQGPQESVSIDSYNYWYNHHETYYWFVSDHTRQMFTEFVTNVNVRAGTGIIEAKEPQIIGHRVNDTPSRLVEHAERMGDVEARYMAVYLDPRREGETMSQRQSRLALANQVMEWSWETHWVFKAHELSYPREWYSMDNAEDQANSGYVCHVIMGQDRCYFRRGNVAARFASRFQLANQEVLPGGGEFNR